MNKNGRTGKPNPQQLARWLGWFSIGLGMAELIAPRLFSRMIGIREHRRLVRLFGAREIASGVGILTQEQPANWVWSRVGGDVMDLAALGLAVGTPSAAPRRLAAAAAAVAGVTALDLMCGQELCRGNKPSGGASHMETSVTVSRPPEEVYRFWRDFQSLPWFMNHLISVRQTSPTRSHWVAKGPAGAPVEWDADIITDKPNEVIAWRSLERSDVANAGSVRFEPAPDGGGTNVRVKMQYRPMAGSFGVLVAKAFGQTPERQVKFDLARFKEVIEAAEIL
jgi:uncharacterized membrane protein